jgi:hypothetical protein
MSDAVAEAASVGRIPARIMKSSTAARIPSARATKLILAISGTSMRNGPAAISKRDRKRTCSANHSDKLNMTPTTAAVIADSG